jgi:sugar phosphate isomerase/epimerase
MKLCLGFDLNCFSNRYMEPEAWTDFVASCGIHAVQFNFDLLDFLLSWDLQEKLAARTLAACARSGIRIKCAFGGHNHHQNYLGHPDDEVARAYEDFYRKMADLTARLGGEGYGTCFAVLDVPTHSHPARRAEVLSRAVEAYHRLAEYARGCGLQYLMYETTSVPRETGATFAENDWILAQMRDAALPMCLCLDVGHRNQEDPQAPEADPYAWIERYGRVAPLIHLQQCNAEASHHWPFLPEFNARGDITPARVLQAIARSGAEQEILLALEIRHRAYYPDEYRLEANLRESVRYWREAVPA